MAARSQRDTLLLSCDLHYECMLYDDQVASL
jgi:hypothetical protein